MTTTAPAITGATGVATGLSKMQSAANLSKAGQQFEAVFDGMMLKSMREAKLADPLFDSQAIDQFSDMQDQQVAQSMAAHQPNGIGAALTKFLSRQPGSAAGAAGAVAGASQPDVNQSPAGPPV